MFSAQILQENTFLETKPNFSLTGKCFPLTNFFNDKQTQESLESGFLETTFRETNIALMKLLMGFIDSIKDSIEINFDHFIKIERLGTQLKLWKAKLVQLVI